MFKKLFIGFSIIFNLFIFLSSAPVLAEKFDVEQIKELTKALKNGKDVYINTQEGGDVDTPGLACGCICSTVGSPGEMVWNCSPDGCSEKDGLHCKPISEPANIFKE